jgi:hypothetical protein
LLAVDPELPQARLNRALICLARGDFTRGWEDYEARRALPGLAEVAEGGAIEWDGSDLAGRSLLIKPEQGLGDEIMFASCIPDVLRMTAKCGIRCHPKLLRLFQRSFPEAEVLPADSASGGRSWDRVVSIGSLPRFLRRSLDAFPAHDGYLRADAARIAHWKARLAALPGTRKVGLSWRGGLPSTRRSLRSIPLEEWIDVLRIPGVDFVSLQYTDCAVEIDEAAQRAGVAIHVWKDALADYDETAALVSAVDLVISVQTSIVHLAGALGAPAWALIAEVPEWRYGEDGETLPWYPSVKLLRRRAGEDWRRVLAQVAAKLGALRAA